MSICRRRPVVERVLQWALARDMERLKAEPKQRQLFRAAVGVVLTFAHAPSQLGKPARSQISARSAQPGRAEHAARARRTGKQEEATATAKKG